MAMTILRHGFLHYGNDVWKCEASNFSHTTQSACFPSFGPIVQSRSRRTSMIRCVSRHLLVHFMVSSSTLASFSCSFSVILVSSAAPRVLRSPPYTGCGQISNIIGNGRVWTLLLAMSVQKANGGAVQGRRSREDTGRRDENVRKLGQTRALT